MEHGAATLSPPEHPEAALDAEGFVLDPKQWSPAVAEVIARRLGVDSLTEEHWRVIHTLRDHYLRLGGPPAIRSVCRRTSLSRAQIHKLFGSCAAVWKIAGLPDPGEEAKAYLN